MPPRTQTRTTTDQYAPPALEDMTAVQLRKVARDEELGITYLSDRKREDLLDRVRKARARKLAAT